MEGGEGPLFPQLYFNLLFKKQKNHRIFCDMSVLKLGEWEEGSAWEFFPLNPVSLRRPLSKLHQHQINFVCFVWTNGNRGERGNRPMGGSQQLVSMVHLGCVEEARNYCHDLQWICWISLQLQVLSERLRGPSKSPVRRWPACECCEVRKGTTFWEALDCLESLPRKKLVSRWAWIRVGTFDINYPSLFRETC